MADQKTIAEAINDVTEDDILEDDDTDTGDASLLDEEDAEESDDDSDDESDDETARTGDVEGEEVEEAADEPPAAAGDIDIFEELTPEQIAEIKANPALNTLRKSLMRGFSAKTQEHSQLVQLGQAYRRDPQGVLAAIAKELGMQVVAPNAAPPPPPAADPGKDLEELFGPQIGPKVRATFEKWAEARFGTKLAPVEQALGRVVGQSEQARMYGEEQAFKARHKDLTPSIEAEIVALGNSGKIVPGDMSPSEYLDTLHDVVMARQARQQAKMAGKSASTKLAKRIESNRRDREPSGVSGRGGTVQKVSRMSEARSISEALDIALEEMQNER